MVTEKQDEANIIIATDPLQGNKYQIRQRCVCNGTECDNCRYYLVESGDKEALVNHKRMVGKAYKLW